MYFGVTFLTGQENHPTFSTYSQFWPWRGLGWVPKMVKPWFGMGQGNVWWIWWGYGHYWPRKKIFWPVAPFFWIHTTPCHNKDDDKDKDKYMAAPGPSNLIHCHVHVSFMQIYGVVVHVWFEMQQTSLDQVMHLPIIDCTAHSAGVSHWYRHRYCRWCWFWYWFWFWFSFWYWFCFWFCLWY